MLGWQFLSRRQCLCRSLPTCHASVSCRCSSLSLVPPEMPVISGTLPAVQLLLHLRLMSANLCRFYSLHSTAYYRLGSTIPLEHQCNLIYEAPISGIRVVIFGQEPCDVCVIFQLQIIDSMRRLEHSNLIICCLIVVAVRTYICQYCCGAPIFEPIRYVGNSGRFI